jgi:predicted nucleotidyltransferase
MSVNSYLTNLANTSIVRNQERESIERSIDVLRNRLSLHFLSDISDQFVFGSYSRNTILPRHMDAQSDVDYMVVFSDTSYRPQTYLNQLRKFAEHWYSTSEIGQSNPTIILELNHIRFELVPAIKNWLFESIQIPAKASSYQNWLDTDPKRFNRQLTAANQANNNLIKPLVRIIKYWNAKAGYPFESYNLEQNIVTYNFNFFGLLATRCLGDVFFDFVQTLDAGIFAPQWKQEAVEKLQRITGQAKALTQAGHDLAAEQHIKALLPPVGGLLGNRAA